MYYICTQLKSRHVVYTKTDTSRAGGLWTPQTSNSGLINTPQNTPPELIKLIKIPPPPPEVINTPQSGVYAYKME